MFAFSLEGELPDSVGPFGVKDLFGGREKVVYVEIDQVSKGTLIQEGNHRLAK